MPHRTLSFRLVDVLLPGRLATAAATVLLAACSPCLADPAREVAEATEKGAGTDTAAGAASDSRTPSTRTGDAGTSDDWGPDFRIDEAALTSHFESDEWQKARDLLVAGKAAAALKSLDSVADEARRTPERLFLWGRILAAAHRPAEAAAALEEAGDAYGALPLPGLAAYAKCLAADAHGAAGNVEASGNLLPYCARSPVPAGGPRVSLASLHSDSGDVDEGLELLRPWLGDSPSAEALVVAAQLSEKANRLDDARDFLLRAWTEDPASSFATQARTRLDVLSAKQKSSVIRPEHMLARADRLFELGDVRGSRQQLAAAGVGALCTGAACTPRSCGDLSAVVGQPMAPVTEESGAARAPFRVAGLRDPEAAKDVRALPACAVETVEEPADPLACRAAFLEGRLLRRARQHTRAMGVLRPVYERCDDPSLRVRALFLAQASASAVRHDDAIGLAWVLSLQFPNSTLGDDALVTASNVARRAGDRFLERALLRRIEFAHPSGDQRGEALFRLFWSYREQGTPEYGLPSLAVLESEHDVEVGGIGADAERGRYWWGRTVALQAAEEDRRAGLDKLLLLARERPLTYYGLLARSFLVEHAPELLEEAGAPKVATESVSLRPGPLAGHPALRTGVELLRLGFTDEARSALASIDLSRLDRADPRAREAHVLVAGLIARTGDLREAHAIVRRDLPAWIRTGDEPLSAHASRLAYPLAYRELIARHARSYGVHADFVQGLMREESALDPKALSPVGARGLTQLMPATARQVAKSLGIRQLNLEALWEPDTNIRLGSNYLGSMLRKFGHPAVAAAAYNAGPTAVGRWIAERGDKPLDEFVEEIPYAETKGYVKRVLRSYATYRFLYGEPGEQLLHVSMSLREGSK